MNITQNKNWPLIKKMADFCNHMSVDDVQYAVNSQLVLDDETVSQISTSAAIWTVSIDQLNKIRSKYSESDLQPARDLVKYYSDWLVIFKDLTIMMLEKDFELLLESNNNQLVLLYNLTSDFKYYAALLVKNSLFVEFKNGI